MNYLYRYNTDNGHLRMAVVHPETFAILWKADYPSFVADDSSDELFEDDTLIELGVMRNIEDVAGLQNHLTASGVLLADDTLAISTEESFAKGGKVKSGFDKLASGIGNKMVGKKVPKKFQKEYGKTYDKKDAAQAGRNIAGSIVNEKNEDEKKPVKKESVKKPSEKKVEAKPDEPKSKVQSTIDKLNAGQIVVNKKMGYRIEKSKDIFRVSSTVSQHVLKLPEKELETWLEKAYKLERDTPAADAEPREITVELKDIEKHPVLVLAFLKMAEKDIKKNLIGGCETHRNMSGNSYECDYYLFVTDFEGRSRDYLYTTYKLTILSKWYYKNAESESKSDAVKAALDKQKELKKEEEPKTKKVSEPKIEPAAEPVPEADNSVYKPLSKIFEERYKIAPKKLWEKTLQLKSEKEIDLEYAFASAAHDLGVSWEDIRDESVLCEMQVALMEEGIEFTEKIEGRYIENGGQIRLASSDKPLPPKPTSALESFSTVVATDDLRPAMLGVYYNVTRQEMAATNAHILATKKEKITGESRIIRVGKGFNVTDSYGKVHDVKPGDVIDARYPDYPVVIPDDNFVIFKQVPIHKIYSQLNGMIKGIKKFKKGEREIMANIDTPIMACFFDPKLFRDILDFFFKNGVSQVDFHFPVATAGDLPDDDSLQICSRAITMYASGNKNLMGLIMPVYGQLDRLYYQELKYFGTPIVDPAYKDRFAKRPEVLEKMKKAFPNK